LWSVAVFRERFRPRTNYEFSLMALFAFFGETVRRGRIAFGAQVDETVVPAPALAACLFQCIKVSVGLAWLFRCPKYLVLNAKPAVIVGNGNVYGLICFGRLRAAGKQAIRAQTD
jgi:hypothetical protein